MKTLPEIILIDKPKGITSFDVIRRLRDRFGKVKMGHAGTLDPLATGLMIIGVGKGTKRLKEYVGLPKTYEAEILLGVGTNTGDMEGEVVERVNISQLRFGGVEDSRFPEGRSRKDFQEEIKKTVESMVGKWILPVPKYSATKQGGEPLYKKVRRGEKVIIPKREMEILESRFLNLESRDEKFFTKAEFIVSSGTYIRSIAEEVGRRLGVPGALAELRRTKVGEFDVCDAMNIGESV